MHACRAPSVCRRRPWRVRRRVGPRHKDGEPLAWREHTGGQQTAAFRGRSRLALTARARPGLGRGALGGHRRTGPFVARHALRRGVCRWRAPRLGARRLPDGRQPRPNMEVRHTRGSGHGGADGRRRVLGACVPVGKQRAHPTHHAPRQRREHACRSRDRPLPLCARQPAGRHLGLPEAAALSRIQPFRRQQGPTVDRHPRPWRAHDRCPRPIHTAYC